MKNTQGNEFGRFFDEIAYSHLFWHGFSMKQCLFPRCHVFLTSPKPRRARRLLETVLISNTPYNPYNLICPEAAPEQRYRTFDKLVLHEISPRIFGLLGDFGMTFKQLSTFSKIVREPSPNTFPSKPSRFHASKAQKLDFFQNSRFIPDCMSLGPWATCIYPMETLWRPYGRLLRPERSGSTRAFG